MITRCLLFLMPRPETVTCARSSRWPFGLLWLSVVLGLLWFPRLGLCQTPIACGQTITGSTTSSSQIVVYSYNGTAGKILSFALDGFGNCFNGDQVEADIYDPNGKLLTTLGGCLRPTSCEFDAGTQRNLHNLGA
jgi:hypothetical protein